MAKLSKISIVLVANTSSVDLERYLQEPGFNIVAVAMQIKPKWNHSIAIEINTTPHIREIEGGTGCELKERSGEYSRVTAVWGNP